MHTYHEAFIPSRDSFGFSFTIFAVMGARVRLGADGTAGGQWVNGAGLVTNTMDNSTILRLNSCVDHEEWAWLRVVVRWIV